MRRLSVRNSPFSIPYAPTHASLGWAAMDAAEPGPLNARNCSDRDYETEEPRGLSVYPSALPSSTSLCERSPLMFARPKALNES